MKYQIPEGVQHKVRVSINQFATLWAKNWFRFSLLGVIIFILANKNLNFHFGLNNSNEPTQNQFISQKKESTSSNNNNIQNNQITDKNSAINIFELTHYLIAELSAYSDNNRVNDFSNIGLVINPDFVKKNKIDPKIVAEKQKIVDNYIKTYTPIALAEQKKYGIPISITIAQGLLESDAGGSRLARNNNNHFGLKCFSKTCVKGHCVNYTDDSHKDFFRNFESAWGSFRGHSALLQKPRYKNLYTLKTTDYKGWARGLQKAGYATDKRYADKLIKIIEILELHKLK
ncbi:MAG: glycoside hydrolase family 73 protein [Saprospiraceae bacterium]